jgi:hypothetical protein
MSGGSTRTPSDEANATLFLIDHDVRSALTMEMTIGALKRFYAIVGGVRKSETERLIRAIWIYGKRR